MAAALGIFSLVRTTVEEARGYTGSEWLPAAIGGGAAVAVMNTAVPSRREWHVRHFTTALQTQKPVGLGLVAATGALSGAVVLGGADRLLDALFDLRIG